MFKFGFQVGQEDIEGGSASKTTESGLQSSKNGGDGGNAAAVVEDDVPAEEVLPSSMEVQEYIGESLALTPTYSIIKASIEPKTASSLLAHDITNTDLVPRQYEGGFKLWEGGSDLASYLASEITRDENKYQGSKVIELGCGLGLPGIVTLLGGAEVHFQDFNKEVLQTLTYANIACNWSSEDNEKRRKEHAASPPVRYFSGSWSLLAPLLEKESLTGSYDLVVTAETIYSIESMQSLYDCIKKCLKRPNGRALVAAKSYYFGVGGSIAAFKEHVKRDNTFSVETIQTINDGTSNIREIVQLSWL